LSLRNIAELFRQPVDDAVLTKLVEYHSTNFAVNGLANRHTTAKVEKADNNKWN
jgi:hypothetical protein